ncbi:MAG: hypothetical protein M3511_05655 [Deinococcota bacterium]|nr:hypothetical protein [Deinococcota bacterium]
MKITLLPLLGPLHLRYPAYNAVTVRDYVARVQPEALAVTALEAGSLDHPNWQDTAEIALPLALVPWAKGQGVPLYPVHEPSPDPAAEGDFRRYLEQYPQGRGLLHEVGAALTPLEQLLKEALDLARIRREVLPVLREGLELKERHFEDGPGTGWLRGRVKVMAGRILALEAGRVAVLASIDHLPFLEDALKGQAELVPAPEIVPSEAARVRSLLDLAFRAEAPEPGNVIAQLREIDLPEARYHEANLLLASGHVAEALDLMERAGHGDFSRPYFLPGYLLARLGQLRDLAGEREAARRAYRAVRALDWAPQEALEAATEGLETPFEGMMAGDEQQRVDHASRET